MKAFWEQLTASQRRTVATVAGLLAAALLLQFGLLPWIEARQRAGAAIAANEKSLAELAVLGEEYALLRQRSAEIQRVLSQRPPGFALFSYLERKAGEAGVKGNLRSINPLKGMPSGAYEETAVEVRLEKLTMKQLADFLYLVEAPAEMIFIGKASIAKMKESPDYLAATLQIFTYQPLSPAGGRPR